jgi:microcystin-dependent protein
MTMSEPFLSEIRIMSFNFAPRNWAFCNGQTLAINQNSALFTLIGTTYGGDGRSTFKLPNLQGMVPIHMGDGFVRGQSSGEATHVLTTQEMPAHNHTLRAKNAQADLDAAGSTPGPTVVLSQGAAATTPVQSVNMYGTAPVNASGAFASTAIATTGNNAAHPNQQPYIVLNFCMALQGIFPARGN